MKNGKLTDEEMIVCAMSGAREFHCDNLRELGGLVVKDIINGDRNSLRQAAARILCELNRRCEDEAD